MRRVEWFTPLDHRWERANQLVNDQGRRICAAICFDFTSDGHEMAGKKNPREWGSITSRRLKSARYQASYVGPDLRRHFAPVTLDSKMIAERWLGKERERIENTAASDEGLGGVETARSHYCLRVAAAVPSGKRKQVTEE